MKRLTLLLLGLAFGISAPAVALMPNAKPNNNSVRRFIRDSLLGSLPAQSCRSCPARRRYRAPQVQPSGNVVLPPVMLVWLLTYSCVTERKAEPTSSRASRSCRSTPRGLSAPARTGVCSTLPASAGYCLPAGVAARDGVRADSETRRRIHIPAAPWPGTPQNIR